MLKRCVLAVVLVVIVSMVVPSVAGAKSTTCDLLTKKQASKILGFKVVKTEYEADKSTGAEQCEYRTNKYWADRFKSLDAPYKLQVTTQPLTPDTATVLNQLEADTDADAVDDLGERAFYTDGNDLVVVVGDVVLSVEVTNIEWKGDELQTYIRGPEFKVMQLLVGLFESLKK